MKKIIYFLIAFILFTACSTEKPVRYFSSSPEIEITKSILKDYVEANWDAFKLHYAETALVANNVLKEKGIPIDSAIAVYKEEHELFTAISYVAKEEFFEMVLTDDNETWVNFWGLWVGTLRSTGEKFEIPIHITFRFMDQKVVLEHGYWNSAAVEMALSKLETQTP